VWQGGGQGEDDLLASCYRNSLALAAEHGARSIAFPSISTGAYRFPLERAARIAVREIKRALDANPALERVVAVCFGQGALHVYQQTLAELASSERLMNERPARSRGTETWF